MEKLLQVGVITSTHGLKGEVKVFPTTDEPDRFLDLDKVILQDGKTERVLEIDGVRFFKKYVILHFKGLNRIEDVEAWRKALLLVTREQALELAEDQYFIADLIGLEVFLEDGSPFGILKEVLQTGANDVYIIDSPAHGEVLLPAIYECILDVNLEENTMKIHLLDGLL